ncbi:hypothetical protein IAT38_008047 [Cryptococcus sp. DSM 104549]
MLPSILFTLGAFAATALAQNLIDNAELLPVYQGCVNQALIYGYNADTTTPGLLVEQDVADIDACRESCWRSEYPFLYHNPESGLCYCTVSQLARAQDIATNANIQCTESTGTLMRMEYLHAVVQGAHFSFRSCTAFVGNPDIDGNPDVTVISPNMLSCIETCGPAVTSRQRLSVITPQQDAVTGEYQFLCECMPTTSRNQQEPCGLGARFIFQAGLQQP